jgi:1,2-diacylglycerol 3-alpha-glucosyltransferase
LTAGHMRLALVFARFGPYHVARLRGAIEASHTYGYEVHGLEMAHTDGYYAWEPLEFDAGIRVTTLIPGRSLESVPKITGRRALVRALGHLDPGCVAIAGYGDSYSLAALAWCRRNGRAAILMSESKRDDSARLAPVEVVKRLVVSLYDAALVGGPAQRAYVARLGFPEDAVALGYDAVDNAFFEEQSDAVRANGLSWREKFGISRPFILASCRFLRRKNVPLLVRAYASYRATVGQQEAWDLVLLGEGADRARIGRTIESLGLAHCVHLRGFRQIEELPAWYALAMLFVHVPLREQWGLVVNEAMASGTPVLVSVTAGASELVVDGRDGWIVDPRNTGALAQALVHAHQLDANVLRRMGASGRERVREWGPERFGKGLLAATEIGLARAARRGASSRLAGWLLAASLFIAPVRSD